MNDNHLKPVVISATDLYQLKPQKGLPGSDRFKVTPKKKPQLVQFIRSAKWNCVDSIVTMEILETPGFSAFDWIYNINIIRKALQKSPFCDIEQDVLTLQFFDEEDLPIGQVKLKGLELNSHECRMHQDKSERLYHLVTVSYESLEIVNFEASDSQAQDFGGISDEEWAKERLDRAPVDSDTFRQKSKWDEADKNRQVTKEFLKDKNVSI